MLIASHSSNRHHEGSSFTGQFNVKCLIENYFFKSKNGTAVDQDNDDSKYRFHWNTTILYIDQEHDEKYSG